MDLQQLPKNDQLWTALQMYQTSDQTLALKTEKERVLFAENFKSSQVPPLTTICLKVIATNYKGRPINLDIKTIQLRTLYDFINAELPLEQCIHINDEYYWKRVYALKCTDKMLLKQKNNQKDVCWKNLAVTLKFVEVIESTPVEIWITDEMKKMTEMVSPYVTELKINKLQALRDTSFRRGPLVSEVSSGYTTNEEGEGDGEEEEALEAQQEEEDEPEFDYPMEQCHHVDLSVLSSLLLLHSLSVEFLPPELGRDYHKRYFSFSYADINNLARAISQLQNLKVFKIRRSRMDSFKCSVILEALKMISIEHLEFYFCQLDEECMDYIYEFVKCTKPLKHLNLSGNYFKDLTIDFLADGIQSNNLDLSYIGLSNNPISSNSLCNIITALLRCTKLTHVTLSGVHVTKPAAICVANLIRNHHSLIELELIAVPVDANTIIDALESNKKIQKLLCQGSGLTLEEELKIEILLKRNRYIKENPYIGDETKTKEEIIEFANRTKNPILLSALAAIDLRTECLRKRYIRDNPPQHSFDIAGRKTSASSDTYFRYDSMAYNEQELDERVVLFGQNETNFFNKQSPQKKNQ